MSQYLENLPIGERIEIMGPIGHFAFQPNEYKNILMIGAGSGITPLYQILQRLDGSGSVTLLYANNKEEDILLNRELQLLPITTQHVLLQPPTSENHNYLQGFLTQRIIQDYIKDKDFILICGPPQMEASVASILTTIGVPNSKFHCFTKSEVPPSPPELKQVTQTGKRYSMAEVNMHNVEQDCWMVIKDKVYDLTKFIDEHPGGFIILDGAGIDATELFTEDFPHTEDAEALLKAYYLGDLEKS